MKITLKVMECDETGTPVEIGKKLVYAAADFGRTCSKWVRETAHKYQHLDAPVQMSGLKFRTAGSCTNAKSSLGYMNNQANDVQHNSSRVGFYSLAYSDGHGLHLYPDNFMRAMALFAARRVIKQTWVNNCDEYVAPTPKVEASEEYQTFAADSLILALFHGANNCTAVRGIPHKGRTIDVANNMFWASSKEMREKADEYHYQAMYNDLRNVSGDPHVSTLLQEGILINATQPALGLLSKADELLDTSMELRAAFSQANPEYHLDSWDAGYYQLKYLWREHYKTEHDELIVLRKELEASLIPRVYFLGFLRTLEES